jgi:Flp pilus assembly secretin CpaC
MEFVFYPRGFGVAAAKSPTIQGGEMDTMVVMLQDVGGDTVKVVFGAEDWKGFAAFVADPEKAAKAAQARAKILPGGKAPTLRERKH